MSAPVRRGDGLVGGAATNGERERERPWFAFERDVSAVPATPTHCRGCGAELEPLRRAGGRCKPCVASMVTVPAPAPTARLASQMTLLREFRRKRAGRPGHMRGERMVEVRCSCGTQRVLQWQIWHDRPPQCCNRCRLRAVERDGFEAEHAR